MTSIYLSDTAKRAEQIAQLNDRARQAVGVACIAVETSGFQGLHRDDQSRIRKMIETFDAFDGRNDLHCERDFGAIYQTLGGRWTTVRPDTGEAITTVFWKIDCYDCALQYGSEDAADPSQTQRVLTIMLAQEY